MALPFIKPLTDLGGKATEVLGRTSDVLNKFNSELHKINDLADKISELGEKIDSLTDSGLEDSTIPIKDLKTEDISPELKETAKEINGLEDKVENEQVEVAEVPSLLDKVGALIDSLQDFVDTLNETLETLKAEIEEGELSDEMKQDFQNLNSSLQVAQNLLERALQIKDSLEGILSSVEVYDAVDLDEDDVDDFESDGE